VKNELEFKLFILFEKILQPPKNLKNFYWKNFTVDKVKIWEREHGENETEIEFYDW